MSDDGQGDHTQNYQSRIERIDLEEGSEWRFELEGDEDIAVRVLSPDPVYINSEELPPTTWYPLFRNLKSSVYAPTPATIEVTSLPASQYASTSTTQPQLISLHLALERLRILSRRSLSTSNGNGQANATASPSSNGHGINGARRGPRVMVLGPPSSGKTSVVKNLVNMAVGSGMGWNVGVAGLDPASPSNLIPGTISLALPSHPLPSHHLAHPLGAPPTTDPLPTLSADVSALGWWYGHLEPTSKGVEVWRKLVSAVGEKWRERCSKDPVAMASGLFVDTSSAFTNPTLGTRKDDPKARYTLIAQAVEAFEIDTLLVLSHEKLSIDLTRLFPSLTVLRLPKSSGAVDLDDAHRQLAHAFQIRTYFYGEPSIPLALSGATAGKVVGLGGGLSPYSFQIGWEKLSVLRVGEENAAPSSALPIGSSRILSPTRLTRVDPSGPAHVHRLMNAVLAIVAVTPKDRIAKPVPEAGAVACTGVKSEPGVVVKPELEDVKPADHESDINAERDGDGGAETGQEGTETKPDVAAGAEAEAVAEDGGENEGEDAVEGQDEEEDEDEVPYIEEIGTREVLGFIVLTGIDSQRKKYTVLSPSPGKLPSTVALAGSIEWVDTE